MTENSERAHPMEPPLWGSLERGSYTVGFMQFFGRDPARVYDLPFGERATRLQVRTSRPILINLWYPVEPPGSGDPMLYREYLELQSDDAQIDKFVRALIAFTRRVTCREVMGKRETDLEPTERTAFEQFLDTRTAAIKDAVPAEGPFPLIINHPGLGGAFEDNAVLFEYLASHGYVVVTSAFQSEDATFPSIDWDMERSVKDLEYLVRYMSDYFPCVQRQPVGVMGQSYGAQAVLGWSAVRNARVSAVVSIDSMNEHASPDWMVWGPLQSRLDRPVNLSAPVLFLAQDRDWTGFGRYESLRYAERYYAKARHLDHNDFLSHGAIGSDIRRRLQREAAGAELIRQSYDLVCTYTLRFLDAYLKEDRPALQALQGAAAGDEMIGGLLSLDHRAAAPLPPTSKQFLDRLRESGLSGARRSFEDFRDEIDYGMLECVADWMADEGHAGEAFEIYKLNTEWCPRSARAWEFLCYAYQERGESALALAACKTALQYLEDDPSLTEHERWLSRNGLSEAIVMLRSE